MISHQHPTHVCFRSNWKWLIKAGFIWLMITKPSIWRGGKNALIKIRIQQILILVSASGERFYNLPNLGGRGVFPPPSPTCENEDTLPFPCYSLHNNELFRWFTNLNRQSCRRTFCPKYSRLGDFSRLIGMSHSITLVTYKLVIHFVHHLQESYTSVIVEYCNEF